MEPFIAFLLIVGAALAANHESNERTEPVPVINRTIATLPTCPEHMKQPLIRDLTVAFEKRVYLLPSGETCRPRPLSGNAVGTSRPPTARDIPAQRLQPKRHDAHSRS